MKVVFLGTGASILTPRPFCQCPICVEAREKGVPYSRLGPSLFIEGPEMLIDTPEEISYQLNRSNIHRVDVCCYSHWHPDHTHGWRVWQCNADYLVDPPVISPTDIYITSGVKADFEKRNSLWSGMQFLEGSGVVTLNELQNNDSFESNGHTITVFPLGVDCFSGYIIEGKGKRVMIIPDEIKRWAPTPDLGEFDLVILPAGVFVPHPITEVEQVPPDHGVFNTNPRFSEVLEMTRQMKCAHFIFTHIYEPDGVSYDQLEQVAATITTNECKYEFAFDTKKVSLL
jgi:phosphoribosyl 1,2-cyclic phosphate phosphodiesterase